MTNALDEYNARRLHERKRKRGPEHSLAASRAFKVKGKPCRLCPRTNVEAHHVVHRGYMKHLHPLLHHPDNLIPLCTGCHADHHTTANRVPRHALTPEEQTFLTTWASPGWRDKWYPIIEANSQNPSTQAP